jgi:hypothetical protein
MTFISLLWSIPVFEAKDSRTESAALIIPPYKQFVLLLVLLSQIRKGVKDLSRGLRRREGAFAPCYFRFSG